MTSDEREGMHFGVELLNTMCHPYAQWTHSIGKRDYVDAFGVLIRQGVSHFRQGYPDVDAPRLADASMKTFVDLLFSRSPELLKKAESDRDSNWAALLDSLN